MKAIPWLRAHRRSTAVVGSLLVLLVLLSALTVSTATSAGRLDPDNPEPEGAQAVARVLVRHGVPVTVVRRAEGLDAARLDADTTLVVTSVDQLGRGTSADLAARASSAGAVVLAGPGQTLLRAFRLPLTVDDARARKRTTAGCDDDLLAGLSVEVGPSPGYRGRSGSTAVGCFTGDGSKPASLVARVDGRTPTYAVGGTDVLTNERVARADNAAVALRLLGQHDRVVWYVADRRDIAAGDAGSVRAQLPPALVPTLWLGAVALVAVMVWRGRRLGRLVVEPLPVVVRAVESTQGRGRLYRRVRDRPHAAEILREATRRRLAARLRLPVSSPAAALVLPVAGATGRDPRDVHDLLVSRPVTDDTTLTRLADDLAALEKEVHQP
ncbi:MAG: DUF4350 domain-containing protein [Nocardioidaceae bacterium]